MAQTIQAAGQIAKLATTVGPASQVSPASQAATQQINLAKAQSKGISALGQFQAITAVKQKGTTSAPAAAPVTSPTIAPIQTKTMLQRGQELQGYADKFAKDIKTGTRYAGSSIYKFGKLSHEVAGQGTPYVKGFLHSVNSSMPYKLVFLFLFFAIFYKIIYRICVFFGIDVVILNMYLGWVSFILVLFTFLPYEYGNVLDTPE